jgi:hypothetical protein
MGDPTFGVPVSTVLVFGVLPPGVVDAARADVPEGAELVDAGKFASAVARSS